MIQVRELTKRFESRTAVDRLSFDVGAGEVVGLLGPNGAGKTTTVRMLSCLIAPSSGDAVIGGFRITEEPEKIRHLTGIVTEVPGLYEKSTVWKNLEFYARLYGVDDIARQIEKYLKLLELWDRKDTAAGTLSKGMKQKVALARCLLHEPKILFLDEPTSGLDPQMTRVVREFIQEFRRQGRTIILCTHNLDEAERLSDRIVVVKTGIVAVDTPQALRRRLFGRTVAVRLRTYSPEYLAAITNLSFVHAVDDEAGRWMVRLDDPEAHCPDLVRALVGCGADVQSITEDERSLADVYLKLVNDTAQEDAT